MVPKLQTKPFWASNNLERQAWLPPWRRWPALCSTRVPRMPCTRPRSIWPRASEPWRSLGPMLFGGPVLDRIVEIFSIFGWLLEWFCNQFLFGNIESCSKILNDSVVFLERTWTGMDLLCSQFLWLLWFWLNESTYRSLSKVAWVHINFRNIRKLQVPNIYIYLQPPEPCFFWGKEKNLCFYKKKKKQVIQNPPKNKMQQLPFSVGTRIIYIISPLPQPSLHTHLHANSFIATALHPSTRSNKPLNGAAAFSKSPSGWTRVDWHDWPARLYPHQAGSWLKVGSGQCHKSKMTGGAKGKHDGMRGALETEETNVLVPSWSTW